MRLGLRLMLIVIALACVCGSARANEGWRGWCEDGNQPALTSGLASTSLEQASYPQCVVTVLVHGGGLATIYSDNASPPTVLANPFTANTNGQWIFYAANGRYDVTMTSGSTQASVMPQAVTYSDILLCDPFVAGSVCNGSAGSTLVNWYLNGTLVGTQPGGDVIVGANQTITATNDSVNHIVHYTFNATGGGGSGCTLPGVDTGVLSEHPVGTCLNSLDWTWNDASSKQNMQAGLSNTLGTGNSLAFTLGNSNSSCTPSGVTCSNLMIFGHNNSVEGASGFTTDTLTSDQYIIGYSQTTGNVRTVFGIGHNNSFTGDALAGTGTGNYTDLYALGFNNLFRATGANTTLFNVVCLLRACNRSGTGVSADTGANIDDSFMVGITSSIVASGAGSNTSSIYSIGENNRSNSSLGSNTADIYQIGESEVVNSAGASSTLLGVVELGFTLSVNSLNGTGSSFIYQLGDNLTTAAFSGVTHIGQIGTTQSWTDCNHVWFMGENWGCSGKSNIVALGFNATTPELQVTAGHAALSAHLDQNATKNFAGTCNMAAGTTCTFTLLAAYSGTPICISAVQSATLTGGVSGCTVSGTTVTITAANSNSLTWGAILVGNPN